jgi:biopolymer transport protein ExbD
MKNNFAQINVVPLVDIMLVLLVIVLVTANFVVLGKVDVNLPKADFPRDQTQELLTLTMRADGVILLDRSPLELGELESALKSKSRDNPVLISADRELTIQPFITLVDALKRLGFNRIGIQTRRNE